MIAGFLFALAVTTGCTRNESQRFDRENSDYTPATIAGFDAFPIYWTGTHFGPYKLTSITYKPSDGFITLIYGTCTPEGGDEPTCTDPVEIQQAPICFHLTEAARSRRWRHRSARGAPIGAFGGGPVLFARRTQIKVYARDGYDQAVEVFDALQSANRLAPVVAPGEPIPAASEAVLTGDRPCDA